MDIKSKWLSRGLGLSLFILFLAVPDTSSAQWRGHPFGLGLQGGNPSLVTAKAWIGAGDALQFGFGAEQRYSSVFNHYNTSSPALYFDWVHQFAKLRPRSGKVWFGFHAGVGGATSWAEGDRVYYDAYDNAHYVANSTLGLLIRAPLAFNVYLRKPRFEFFFEITPFVRLLPYFTPLEISGALGARYYF
ncbi:hypothetical protein KAI87_10760 [Myxococcota bacterium]|nr:hypothetical protein [Myxococcota bacterium]